MENKELLLKDLCARLPYGVKCENFNHVYGKNVFEVTDIRNNGYICGVINNQHCWAVFDSLELKPYLFPLSSMTEEQKIECFGKIDIEIDEYNEIWSKFPINNDIILTNIQDWLKVIDWLNKNHFDYRGLIPMGLALDATGLGIY